MERTDAPPASPSGSVWALPAGWTAGDLGECRSCHVIVQWATTPAGKRAPLNQDGISHFATCPQSNNWRKPRGTNR